MRVMMLALLAALAVALGPGCEGDTGPAGPSGTDGRNGTNGTNGTDAMLVWETWSTGNFTQYDWELAGTRPWMFGGEGWPVGGSVVVYGPNNTFACSDPALTDNESADVSIDVVLPKPGVLAFWARVSSEPNYDWLIWYADDTILNAISGNSGGAWTEFSYPLPSGAHTIRWTYYKDVSLTSGADRGDVDNVRIFLPTAAQAPSFVLEASEVPEGVVLWTEAGEAPAK